MQKKRWEEEYKKRKDLPSTRTLKPSRAIVQYLEKYTRLNDKGIRPRALDLGSGNGRNAIYLAENGYYVEGVEMVEFAVEQAVDEAHKKGVNKAVNFTVSSVGEKLKFDDQSFDLVYDIMTLHLLDKRERDVYAHEVQRLLKRGGHYLFYTILADSPAAKDLFIISPGPEKNSYVIPQSGMIEKAFSEVDVRRMFPRLEIVGLSKDTQFTPAFGDIYERVYLMGLLRKP